MAICMVAACSKVAIIRPCACVQLSAGQTAEQADDGMEPYVESATAPAPLGRIFSPLAPPGLRAFGFTKAPAPGIAAHGRTSVTPEDQRRARRRRLPQ
jgi:hypothetical protein